MAIKKQDRVRVKVHVIEGVVLDAKLDADLRMHYLVEYKNEAGEMTQRYFTEDQFAEVIPAK